MGWYKNWASKQHRNPAMLGLAVVSGTVCIWIGYRTYYAPWRARNRLHKAEEYANILLNNEEDN
ncbi:hypothetical protein BDFB_005591 [Asbolus verrucosus]|uniref:Uncharacterized protein n=1 Tax=Asbolus verrucosus TaxID=1661398 RepID=A0A482V4C1_ASBVE|nr:hypothetical protein BDFB_005591 [Asbolus verrucosus]